ncbi:MAG: DUF3048 domain-containing protein [Chloroflexi bacterium]|nr:DUF3048 domain-containing protein [Chloroflexota bacterium]
MFFIARPILIIGIVLAALSLAACEAADATPTPRPTWTPRVVTIVVTPTPEPTNTIAPTPVPVAVVPVPTSAPAPRVAAPAPVVNDPLLPKFAPFPPVPIPARPANINPLTGLQVDPAVLQRRPIVARIGNDQIVRTSNWHAGLSQADLVFEELIDILGSQYANTRYSAVYLTNDPPALGPIRSGRIVNFQIVPMFDAALAHAGASNGTRWLFSQSPMVNLDEYFNQPAFCYDTRHGYQGRLYTSAVRIREWLKQKGWEAPVPLYGFNFSTSAPAGSPVTSIALTKAPWPTWDALQWKYDAASGSYLRFATNSPHMDSLYSLTAKWGNGADCVTAGKETQVQIRAANVVILYAPHEKTNIIEDSNNAVSVHITLTGQGNAQFFRDGVSVSGKWARGTEQEFFKFTDSAGNPVSLKPGITWFEIVPVGYQPDLK